MDTLSLTKEARIYNRKKTTSLTSGSGKTGQPHVKNETRTLCTYFLIISFIFPFCDESQQLQNLHSLENTLYSTWPPNTSKCDLVFRFILVLRNQRPNAKISWIVEKSKRVPKNHLLLLYWLCQSLWLWGSQQTVENSERDGNTRQPDLSLEKSVCRSRSNS